MNKIWIMLICACVLAGCSSMDVRPTVGVSVGTKI